MKRYIFTTAATVFLFLAVLANAQILHQQAPQRVAINAGPLVETFPLDGIQAAFTAEVRSGIAPLTVNFTDQSSGEITSWNWDFGDGQSSTERNPAHVYIAPGRYSVSLAVTDGNHTYTLEKEDYIIVQAGLGACDTLDFPFAGTYTFYILQHPQKGYVSGTNSYGDLAKANKFKADDRSYITGALVDFAKAINVSQENPDIKIAVWNNAGLNGRPGDIIGFKEIPFQNIVDDVNDDVATWVAFDTPIAVEGDFYVGAVLPTTGDTLAFWTDTQNESPANKGFEQWEDQSWHAYSTDQSWGLLIGNAIHPVVCDESTSTGNIGIMAGLSVFPVPARKRIYISSTGGQIEQIELYNLQGAMVVSQKNHSHQGLYKLDIPDLQSGVYMLRVVAAGEVSTTKVSISR